MPEGPEIARAANKLAAVLVNKKVLLIEFAFTHLKPFAAAMIGSHINTVQARSKAMLIALDCGLTIYSHNQLYGRWAILAHGQAPQPGLQVRLAIHVDDAVAVLYSASAIEVWPSADIEQQPYLRKLGLELLAANATIDGVLAHITQPKFQGRRAATLLLDQSFLAGIGNYLRSDILYAARIHPDARMRDLTAMQTSALAHHALAMTQQSFATNGITNDLTIVKKLKNRGLKFGQYRHWVFDRAGEPCHVCGVAIARLDLSGRAVFWCVECQR